MSTLTRVLAFLSVLPALTACGMKEPEPAGAEAATQVQSFVSAERQNKSADRTNKSADRTDKSADRKHAQPAPEKSPAGQARLMELPETAEGEAIVSHTGYTLSFNTTTLCPNWVAWELTASETRGHLERSRDFFPDDHIPARQRVTTNDYTGSGYTRGHMCPAADMEWGAQALHDCFLMSNMCPQSADLNRYGWEKLEKACRRWARKEGKVLIVCGPIYYKERKARTIGRQHKVRVPDAFFKCVCSTRKGHEKAIGFIYANNDSYQTMAKSIRTVDDIERLTGYNFFVNLPDPLEERIERRARLDDWP